MTGAIQADTKFDAADFCNTVPRLTAENRDANRPLVDLLARFGRETNATPAQIVLA